MKKTILLIAAIVLGHSLSAQDDLLGMLSDEREETIDYVEATFKGQRMINGHTVVTRKAKELEFIISHRFGRINTGINELFGLDGANIRFSFEYGISDFLTVGVGRSSFEKIYDGFAKYQILRQSSGKKVMPVSITGFSSMAIRTLDNPAFQNEEFSDRVAYTHQLLIARKMNETVSLQFMPTYVHRNRVMGNQENDLLALGVAGRVKVGKRVAINSEYYYRLTNELTDLYKDSIGIGVEIETGGHVFHLTFTNSRSMVEKGFITETDGDFFNGDIHFGFNLSRVF
ncbi:DUF5777 family beta-barrel protein [uncultured Roseivirga sp.]|uniref:DUF5777 family beta-barrel protein n=1 Tax=uncultured Roseivirga sp. TaxID=543088 RepID=UPI0025835AFE|nr:DUF5777 family beta-barrel protein [uncultured Roseivirga sp.]